MTLIKSVCSRFRATAMAALIATSSFAPSIVSADVIMHAFNWRYDQVTAKAQEIADLGYTKVLVAPALKSPSACEWYQRYQPQDWRVIDHCLGNKEDFKEMIDALAARGVETYADIVLNHMANERNAATDFPGQAAVDQYNSNPTYWNNQKLFGNLQYGLLGSQDFHPANCIGNYNDKWQVENWRLCGAFPDPGLPDLAANNWVLDNQRTYLQSLKNLGITGFRVDAAKHMSSYHINAIFTNQIKSDMHIFGEVITGGGTNSSDYQLFLGPYLQETGHGAYDFPLLNTMRNALGLGGSMTLLENPVAFGNALSGNLAVTMPITHDIPTNQGFRYLIMDPTDEFLAYAYVLGRADGVPMVLSDGTGSDNNRWRNDHAQSDIAAMVRFHNKVQGAGQETLWSDDCVLAFRRGKEGLVAINKCGTSKAISFNTNERFYWFRDYRETFTNGVTSINSSSKTITVPARSARMWYAD